MREAKAANGYDASVETAQSRLGRLSSARLLKRAFDIEMQHCLNCRARELRIIGAILERSRSR